jgi:hypothetical protein
MSRNHWSRLLELRPAFCTKDFTLVVRLRRFASSTWQRAVKATVALLESDECPAISYLVVGSLSFHFLDVSRV